MLTADRTRLADSRERRTPLHAPSSCARAAAIHRPHPQTHRPPRPHRVEASLPERTSLAHATSHPWHRRHCHGPTLEASAMRTAPLLSAAGSTSPKGRHRCIRRRCIRRRCIRRRRTPSCVRESERRLHKGERQQQAARPQRPLSCRRRPWRGALSTAPPHGPSPHVSVTPDMDT